MEEEEEEEILNHFSHEEHPLILSQVDNIEAVLICYGCGEQILELQAYVCFHCDLYLHKICAKLPLEITHPMHSQHPLILLKNPSYQPPEFCFCNACGRQNWKLFTYHCSLCTFDVDVLCFIVDLDLSYCIVERRIDHKSHEHPLIFQPKPAAFLCSACNKQHRDASYFCTSCPFWIHKSCLSMPDSVDHKHHNHPLLLAYSLPDQFNRFPHKCFTCHGVIYRRPWVYYCGPCRYFIHLKCIISKDTEERKSDSEMEEFGQEKFIKLPMEENVVQNIITRFLLKPKESRTRRFRVRSIVKISIRRRRRRKHATNHRYSLTLSRKNWKIENCILHPGHDNHRLFLFKEMQTQVGSGRTLMLCDGCIEPIIASDLHYKCISCNYFLHVACKKPPAQLYIPTHHEHPLALDATTFAVIGALCVVCKMFSNSIFYACRPCLFHICIKCLAAAFLSRIVHKAHKHILTQIRSWNPIKCSACGFYEGNTDDGYFAFGCEDCEIYLHYGCALLPPSTSHRWDKHLLILMFPPYFEHPNDFYCEICEVELNPNQWMYHCRECDQSFHPFCLPHLRFINMKLGRNLHVDDHVHDLLTLVFSESYKSFCFDCGGRVYECLAFECTPCRFYLCRSCAAKRERRRKQTFLL